MREIYDYNDSWLFSKTCEQAPAELPQGEGWEPVTLPHTWNAVDGQIGVPFERGAYWYVTSLETPQQPIPGGRLYVEVGAAGLVGEIWVNGQFIKRHVGGYSIFRADVTDALKDKDNILAILVDNRYSDKVYPQRADFTFYGGLYRYVRLISVPESRISLDEFGGPGVYIDAEPAEGGANVAIRVHLTNPVKGQRVSVQLYERFEEENIQAEVWGFAAEEVTLKAFIPDAQLWDEDSDYALYTARIRLVSHNEVVDEIEQNFGVRTFEIDPEEGFFLNGEAHPLRGVCRHQDRLYLGNALEEDLAYEDAEIIKEMGANTVRLAHYQQAQEMYDACDELGLVCWAEIPYFASSWDDDAHAAAVNEIKELVAQNYNHPSIFCWGLSNEIMMGGKDAPKLIPCHEDLNAAVKSLDPKRLTVAAHEYETPWEHKLHDITDAEGWNHYFGWYRGQAEDLAKWCDDYHAAYPDRRIGITEYGCDAVIDFHSDTPQKMDYTEEYQVLIHENACETWATRPWIWGTYVWNMFDFGSSFRREGGTRGRNNKGLVTMDRKIRKDSFYVYKAWYSDDPFVHIDGRRYFARPGETTTIRVHSNLDQVSLFVDDVLFDIQNGEHTFIFENVPISKEGTIITARARYLEEDPDEELRNAIEDEFEIDLEDIELEIEDDDDLPEEYIDTITLVSVDAMPEEYTFEGFKETQDAINWFHSVSEVAGTLESKPGFFSVHDSLETIAGDHMAKKALMSSITAALERALPEQMLLGGADLTTSAADFLSEGMISTILGDKKEPLLRKLHAALSAIPKR